MRKPDELALYAALRVTHSYPPDINRRPANEVAQEMGMHANRLHAILEKWDDNDWWDYGVSLRTGWLTEDAPAVLEARSP